MTGEIPETIPDRGVLQTAYEAKRLVLAHLLAQKEIELRACLEKIALRPTIKGRIKSFDSLYAKRIRLLRQARMAEVDPIPITDIIALRAVCPFLGDLSKAERAINSRFDVIELERKGSERSFREFGYESIHILIALPPDAFGESIAPILKDGLGICKPAMEIQLRTILQEAWAEVEHELVYKAEFTPFDEPMKRKLAALNANLSLSDIIFQEILDYQRRLNTELERRRSAFHGKIENAMDRPFEEMPGLDSHATGSAVEAVDLPGVGEEVLALVEPGDVASMDDLLLAALTAHNREDYVRATRLYSEILAQEPGKEISAVVFKHRGMAYFSQSKYDEALLDFERSIELDPSCYKAAYYRGVVKSVLQDFPGALQDFDRALSIHPYHFYSRYRRGMAYWHIGDFAQALADFEAALKLEPDNLQAARLRDLVLKKLAM
jgi:putative GTP pyrophosphokinase